MRHLVRVRKRLLAYTLAFHKHQVCNSRSFLPSFALDVVHHVSEFYVSIKPKIVIEDQRIRLKTPSQLRDFQRLPAAI